LKLALAIIRQFLMNLDAYTVDAGKPIPMGSTLTESGVNFSLFARRAEAVTLALFDSPDPESRRVEIKLDKKKNRTGDIRHSHVRVLKAGALYLYRVDCP
jgi:glycogen operon protein